MGRSSGSLVSVIPEVFPEIGPRLADVTDKHVVVPVDGGVFDAIAIGEAGSPRARAEDGVENIALQSQGDHRLGRQVAVAAHPVGIQSADIEGKPYFGPYKLIALFAFVAPEDSKPGLLCSGQSRTNGGDGLRDLRPSDLHIEVAVDAVGHSPPCRAERGYRQR